MATFESSLASFTRCASPPDSVVAGWPSLTVMEAATRAHRRMEVIQTVRKLRRTRGGDPLGPA